MIKPKKSDKMPLESEYYIIFPNMLSKNMHIYDHQMTDFRVSELWTGRAISHSLENKCQLSVKKGLNVDMLNNTPSWLVCSQKMINAILIRDAEYVQILSLQNCLFENGVSIEHEFSVVNPLMVVDAIAGPQELKSKVSLTQIRLVRSVCMQCPAGLFRLAGAETTFVITRDLAERLRSAGVSGCRAMPVDVVS